MNSSSSNVEMILGAVSEELESAKIMLLRYEEDIAKSELKDRKPSKFLQDFDLAIQILTDLNSTLNYLSRAKIDGLEPASDFPYDEIKLERIRSMVLRAASGVNPSDQNESSRRIEFF